MVQGRPFPTPRVYSGEEPVGGKVPLWDYSEAG